MILNKIDDPRDNLERAKRLDLVRFANANGLNHITVDHPAILIRAELRSKGLTNIKIPHRPLGSQGQGRPMAGTAPPPQNIIEVNAAADLARQFAHQQQQPPPPPLTEARPARSRVPPQEINILRAECRKLGIKLDRGDNTAKLKAKIAAHGQVAPQFRQ